MNILSMLKTRKDAIRKIHHKMTAISNSNLYQTEAMPFAAGTIFADLVTKHLPFRSQIAGTVGHDFLYSKSTRISLKTIKSKSTKSLIAKNNRNDERTKTINADFTLLFCLGIDGFVGLIDMSNVSYFNEGTKTKFEWKDNIQYIFERGTLSSVPSQKEIDNLNLGLKKFISYVIDDNNAVMVAK